MFKLFIITLIVILLQCDCNASSSRGRIINGNLVENIPPYHATLIISNSVRPDVEGLGSGVLVSLKHILTTAYNIYGYDTWRAGFGSLNYFNLKYVLANGALIHEDFNVITLENNIGVIYFSVGVYIDGVQPGVLPLIGASLPHSGEVGRFAAFSYTDYLRLNFSQYMLESVQTVMKDGDCPIEMNHVFCGIDLVKFSSPCGGEQGGAFIINENGVNIVAGIVSSVTRICNAVDAKTIFIRVADYRYWLTRLIGV